jgi:YHS domain-containing protein
MAKDPVCGMSVDEKTAVTSVYKGATYYFCSKGCQIAFNKDPEKYVTAKPQH